MSTFRLRRAVSDASQQQTDVEGFKVLEPEADGFRNYQKASTPFRQKTCWSTKRSY